MEMHLQRIVPEFIILGTALFLLILDLFMKKRPRRSFAVIGILGIVASGVCLACQDKGESLAGMFIQDAASIFFKWLFLIIAAVVLYITAIYEKNIRNWRGEFYSLLLFATVGMMLLASSADFVSFYVSLEFLAVSLYILAAFTHDRGVTVESGLKYIVTGALSSGVLLYGVSFIYGSTGSTAFTDVAGVLGTVETTTFLKIGLVLVVLGLTFKISSIPFHVWAPDIYQGAPTPVTALLASGSKAAGFVVIMRILFSALGGVKAEWVPLVAVLSGASLIFGNMAAMPQKDIKRLIAYAGIGSAGYLLMAVAAATVLGAGAMMFYLLSYTFAILGTFLAIVIFYNSEGSYHIDSYAGLSMRSPLLAATLFIGLLSIAGIPPLGGFIAKFYIIAAAIQEGFWTLAVIGVVMAIVAMYYFLLVIKSMYLRLPVNTAPIPLDMTTRVLLYVINAVTIILGVYPGPFTDWAMDIATVLF
ncbi:MAG: NADH-quinone oxidoreductase subunit N [Thermodesulfobacteriota bacterium]